MVSSYAPLSPAESAARAPLLSHYAVGPSDHHCDAHLVRFAAATSLRNGAIIAVNHSVIEALFAVSGAAVCGGFLGRKGGPTNTPGLLLKSDTKGQPQVAFCKFVVARNTVLVMKDKRYRRVAPDLATRRYK
ncbi:hypothetical protein GN958_ATG08915 [Phytophthora infestans]|uniref:Uncharacterized protein n=1 Tax=Phytophthora infestans TaxID=4787 RepID=A0A8S9US58_PHYIN|nr:hypothetical protein GN958_ATG08915 [Phytophthora infestans]